MDKQQAISPGLSAPSLGISALSLYLLQMRSCFKYLTDPFLSRSYHLLEKLLLAHHHYFTNIFLSRPPEGQYGY